MSSTLLGSYLVGIDDNWSDALNLFVESCDCKLYVHKEAWAVYLRKNEIKIQDRNEIEKGMHHSTPPPPQGVVMGPAFCISFIISSPYSSNPTPTQN